jgi:hypothetical protein
MDKKDIQNPDSFNNPMNWKSLGFFSVEDYLIYVFKKTEKITSALYLVSSLLKDEEPLKWEIRDKGIDLLSSSFVASSAVPGDKNSVIQSLFTAALETLSLLNVARISHLISDMNHNILVREIDQVVALLRDRLTANAESAGYVLSESFFKTAEGFKPVDNVTSNSEARNSKSLFQSSSLNTRSNTSASQGHSDVQFKKTHRQEAILNILKGQSNLTIKDFSKVIKDCSEKTIQRELIELLDKGVIKKEGERRWSRYSLK